METKTRKVRLYRKCRWLTDTGEAQEVPWLNVSGLWLEEAGFKAGDRVGITVCNNELIIKNLSADGDTRD